MAGARARWVVDPVKGNESQASEHENDARDQEDQRLEKERNKKNGLRECGVHHGGLVDFEPGHVWKTSSLSAS